MLLFYLFVANWNIYMAPTITTGSIGEVQVGNSTLASTMRNWSIPEQFRDQAVQSVRLFISGATEGSYISQAYMFNIESRNSSLVLVVTAKKITQPTDPNSPVVVNYVIINTTAEIKQQYSEHYTHRCFRCGDCVYLWDCCCKTYGPSYLPRENTPEEWILIKQKLTADQYTWFKQKNMPTTTFGTLVKRAV